VLAVSGRSRSKKLPAGTRKSAAQALSSVENATQNDGKNGSKSSEALALRDRIRKATSTDGTFDIEIHVECIAREIERVMAMRSKL